MPQSAFAVRQAAARAEVKKVNTTVTPPVVIHVAQDESCKTNSNSKSRQKRRKIVDTSSITTSTLLHTLSQPNSGKTPPQADSLESQSLVPDDAESPPSREALELNGHNSMLASDSTTEVISLPMHEITWTDSYQDAEISLPAGQSLAIAGECDLWLQKGSISVLGAMIHSSANLHRLYAPKTHAIPLVEALVNPFGPSFQTAKFRLHSISSGLCQLRKCNSRFSRIWGDEQKTAASFQILSHNEASQSPVLSVPDEWPRLAIKLSDREQPPIVMVCGPKNAGKSSFAKYLSNSFLSRRYAESGIAYLDIDPGQPEYTAPADLSLLHIKSFNLGPPFTHPTRTTDQHNLLVRQHHFGYFSPREDLGNYLDCAGDLYNHYKQNFQQLGCPLIINTSGWTQGFGTESLLALTKRILPTRVVYLAPPEIDDETRSALQRSTASLNVEFSIVPTTNHPLGPRSAADLRSIQFTSCFHVDTTVKDEYRWNAELLLSSKPIALAYDGKDKVISGVLLLGDQINYEMLEPTINKTVVALVAIDRSSNLYQILQQAKSVEPQYIDIDAEMQDDPIDEFGLYTTDSADQTIENSHSCTLLRNSKGIPYLTYRTGVNSPPDPATSWSLGQALLDKVDTSKRVIHLHTSIPLHAIRSCLEQDVSLILVRGQLGMPEWAYLEEYYLSRAIEEDAAELQSLDGTRETNMSTHFDLKTWAQNTDYVEYQDTQGFRSLNKVRKIRRNLGTTGSRS